MDKNEVWYVFKDGNLLFPQNSDYGAAIRGIVPKSAEVFINLEEHFIFYDERDVCHVLYLEADRLVPELNDWQSIPL